MSMIRAAAVSRPSFISSIRGLCRDVKDFFSRIFIKKRGLDFPVFPLYRRDRGDPSQSWRGGPLAHAASHFHGPGLARTLEAVGEKPLDGFECYHPAHSKEDTKTLLAYCQQHHKLISGGSDCHGRFVDGRIIGHPDIHESEIRLF